MNNQRRKELAKAKEMLDNISSVIEDCKNIVESCRDEEAVDNLETLEDTANAISDAIERASE